MYVNLVIKSVASLLCLAMAGGLGALFLRFSVIAKQLPPQARFLAWLVGVLPFAYGGYYPICGAVVSGLLFFALLRCRRQRGSLRVCCNLAGLAVAVIVLFYLVSPLWGVDRGMSLFGLPKYLPLGLFVLLLMQQEAAPTDSAPSSGQLWCLAPATGCLMILQTLVLQCVPVCRNAFFPDGRMAGFFEYPNTLALFLMIGVAVLLLEQTTVSPKRVLVPQLLLLLFGILQTGSRIGFYLLTVELLVIAVLLWKHRDSTHLLLLSVCFVSVLGLAWLMSRVQTFYAGTRYTTAVSDPDTLYVRLLYYRDALREIPKHPFGLGYYGYASFKKVFQHGVYRISFVHNDLLQLILDVGFLPAFLLTVAILQRFFDRRTPACARLVLVICCTFCMFEFHLEYLSIWLLLLLTLDFRRGRVILLHRQMPGKVCGLLAGVLILIGLWLGVGDTLYISGYPAQCLRITPMHTRALEKLLSSSSEPAARKHYATRILSYQPFSAEAWDCLADQAAACGDTAEAIRCSEQAMDCAPFDREYYLHTIDRMEALLQSTADPEDTALCRALLERIPTQMEATLQRADPLAWKNQHPPELTLPPEYLEKLRTLLS